jgi:hypothetical protein
MAPLPDIIVSTNTNTTPASPALSVDSGIGSPREMNLFSFEEDDVAAFRDQEPSAFHVVDEYQYNAPLLAQPPRGRRVDDTECDEGLGDNENSGPSQSSDGKKNHESVVIDMPVDSDVDFIAGDGPRESHRVTRRWNRLGRDLRYIADNFHFARTGVSTYEK